MHTNGTVQAHSKISALAGGFTGVLKDSDRFGSSVASLGDVDSDGVLDIAVGARFSRDGGLFRGSIWVVFLNTTGMV